MWTWFLRPKAFREENAMANLEVCLDSFMALEALVQTPLSNPLHLLGPIEAVGIPGISLNLGAISAEQTDLDHIRNLTGARLNLRVPAEEKQIARALGLAADLITVVNNQRADRTLTMNNGDWEKVLEPIVRNRDCALSVRLQADIRELKAAYQMGIDEVEIATDHLATVVSQTDFYNELGEVNHAIQVGQKNNLMVSIGGGLDRRLIAELLAISSPHFISVGRSLLAQSLHTGFEQALRNYYESLL